MKGIGNECVMLLRDSFFRCSDVMPVASADEGGALPQALDLPSRSLRDSPALSVTLRSGLYCPALLLRARRQGRAHTA